MLFWTCFLRPHARRAACNPYHTHRCARRCDTIAQAFEKTISLQHPPEFTMLSPACPQTGSANQIITLRTAPPNRPGCHSAMRLRPSPPRAAIQDCLRRLAHPASSIPRQSLRESPVKAARGGSFLCGCRHSKSPVTVPRRHPLRRCSPVHPSCRAAPRSPQCPRRAKRPPQRESRSSR